MFIHIIHVFEEMGGGLAPTSQMAVQSLAARVFSNFFKLNTSKNNIENDKNQKQK